MRCSRLTTGQSGHAGFKGIVGFPVFIIMLNVFAFSN